jgi:hypothetical protein
MILAHSPKKTRSTMTGFFYFGLIKTGKGNKKIEDD